MFSGGVERLLWFPAARSLRVLREETGRLAEIDVLINDDWGKVQSLKL